MRKVLKAARARMSIHKTLRNRKHLKMDVYDHTILHWWVFNVWLDQCKDLFTW